MGGSFGVVVVDFKWICLVFGGSLLALIGPYWPLLAPVDPGPKFTRIPTETEPRESPDPGYARIPLLAGKAQVLGNPIKTG